MFHATLTAYAENLSENEMLRELKSVRKIYVLLKAFYLYICFLFKSS